MFSTKMLSGNRNRNSSRTENDAYGIVRNRPAFGSHQSFTDSDKTNEHRSLTQRMDHLAISSNNDRFMSPNSFSSMTVSRVNQGNIMSIGERLASVKSGAELVTHTATLVSPSVLQVPKVQVFVCHCAWKWHTALYLGNFYILTNSCWYILPLQPRSSFYCTGRHICSHIRHCRLYMCFFLLPVGRNKLELSRLAT